MKRIISLFAYFQLRLDVLLTWFKELNQMYVKGILDNRTMTVRSMMKLIKETCIKEISSFIPLK